ncbi:MAG: hypothetical protein WBM28_12345 [Burkholderiales bacterium]
MRGNIPSCSPMLETVAVILKRSLAAGASLALAVLLCACTQSNTGDQPAASGIAFGLDRFLLFPNPIAQNAEFETDTDPYAEAYYHAIDPANQKDTLDKWKAANGFGSGSGAEHLAVFRDVKDLGYGRRMTGRMNTDGSVAFFVQNYDVASISGGGYSSLNVEAAVAADSKWHVGTNAIEWSTAPCTVGEDPADCNAGVKFAKFYNFSPGGARQFAVDLDGKGLKAMPGPCITCHGGRGDPLTPADAGTGKPRFALVEDALSRKRGDTLGRLQGQNVGSFEFSAQAGWTRADQEANLKDFNQWVLCTYPLAGAASGPEDACRAAAGANEWQGTAAEMVKAWYGGPGMTNPAFLDNYVPSGWSANSALYTGVVGPFCRTCHAVRGTKNQDDIDFITLAKFQGYADRVKVHVFDRGNMPLALIVYKDFWQSSAPGTLALYIDSVLGAQTATTASGDPLTPGRPVANPGPNRMVRTGANATLSAEDSLFATTYNWSPVSTNPPGLNPVIGNAASMFATFSASVAGDYTVRLTASDGARTDSKDVVITVDDTFHDPSTLKFAHVQNVLQNVLHNKLPSGTATCVSCHALAAPTVANTPPIWYTNFDRNGDGPVDATDSAWFYKALMGRVNLTEIQASPLLRKPSGNHHNGGTLFDLTTTAGLRNYSIIYNWILAGAPSGGVAANAGADSSNVVTFSGAPLSAGIALDGSSSIGATSYAWSVVSQPAGGNAAIASPTSATTTLSVENVGTYVVQLQVSDGTSTDTAQRTITVTETPLTFNVAVAGLSAGTVSVPFSGAPAAGTITVNATQITGIPVSCIWTVAPAASGVTIGANTCSGATLNVASSAIGSTYSVTLTQQNVSLPAVPVSQSFTVTAASGFPTGADFTPTTSTISFTINGVPGSTPSQVPTGITLTGSASGAGTLSYSWTTTAGTAGCSIPAGSSTVATKTLSYTSVGTCSVTLTVSNGILPNATVIHTVTISSGVVFSDVANLLGSGGAGCTGCHTSSGGSATPSWDNDPGLLSRLITVINTGSPQLSLLLICPYSHGDAACSTMPSPQPGFGSGGFANYDEILTWIMNGTP